MRIDEIEVVNFRGIRELSLKNLKGTVVIAGANGSGKSCVFDAIRLLKSAYGGYQQNEWHHWMAEFQINFGNDIEAFKSFFQDPAKKLSIRCVFRLHPKEREYLKLNGKELVRQSVWRLIAPEMYSWSSYRAAPMAAQYRHREPEVAAQTDVQFATLLAELSQEKIVGHLWGVSGSDIQFSNSKALEILFSSYFPGQLGLIDYHGPQRMYTREQVSNVSLDLSAREQQSKQTALYNYNAKYGNVKTEMASSFIKELLAKAAGVSFNEKNALSDTLKELFTSFFPDKEFLGLKPTPNGGLEFPVRTSSGAVHDLNELSAGEKEVLYGYLRIRNSAPAFSIILIDEPELHLNPRLIRGLPKFYHHNLGEALDNQIWLVTHSDALLREVVGHPEYSVFHMVGASLDLKSPQIIPLEMGEPVSRAMIMLVGDIAAYQPGKKVVVFEGGGDSEFDVQFVTTLFPELAQKVNVISGGNKLRVRELHDVLEATSKTGIIPFKTYSITDLDGERSDTVIAPRFRWDVYHVENYLLEAEYIKKVLVELGDASKSLSKEQLNDWLRTAAASTLNDLVQHKLRDFVNNTIVKSINLGFDRNREDVAAAMSEAIDRSTKRINKSIKESISEKGLLRLEKQYRTAFKEDIATDGWKKSFRGRDILKALVQSKSKVSYEVFRNLVVARMSDAGFKPKGVAKVVNSILAD